MINFISLESQKLPLLIRKIPLQGQGKVLPKVTTVWYLDIYPRNIQDPLIIKLLLSENRKQRLQDRFP